MSPKVSILIATYNRAQFIEQAIQSVLDQTLKDWELIIADDGSTDSTEKIAREWEKKDPRIKYFKAPHFGRIAKISNFGLKHAKGKYVAVLDDDDWWIDPKKLEKQIQFLDQNSDYVGCGGGFVITDVNGNEKTRALKPEQNESIRKNALIANPIANATAIFRRSAGEKVGFYDETMLQFADWDFWLKLGLVGKLYNFQEYFTSYRMWDGGMSFSKQKETAASASRIVRRYKKKYPRFLFAFIVSSVYSLYINLPASLKKFLNPALSRLKKSAFSS